MAELPEIYQLGKQMQETLKNKKVDHVEIRQEKCINTPVEDLLRRCTGQKIETVTTRGKWIFVKLSNKENLLISLGMGGDLLYFLTPKEAQEEFQIKVNFDDRSGFTIKFWWFGKFHIVHDSQLKEDKNTAGIASHPFEEQFTPSYFSAILKGSKGKIKPLLLNQKKIAGIGNMYIHDILFLAKIHPDKKANSLTEEEITKLYHSILDILKNAYNKKGFSYEKDFFGQNGGYTTDEFLIAYQKEGHCPCCNTAIEKIKTGATSTYICPVCQQL